MLWNTCDCVGMYVHTARFSPENYPWQGAWVYPWSNDGGSWAPCRGARYPTRWSSSSLKFFILSAQSVYWGKGVVCSIVPRRAYKGHFYDFQQSAITCHHSQYGNYRTGGTFDDAHAPCYKSLYITTRVTITLTGAAMFFYNCKVTCRDDLNTRWLLHSVDPTSAGLSLPDQNIIHSPAPRVVCRWLVLANKLRRMPVLDMASQRQSQRKCQFFFTVLNFQAVLTAQAFFTVASALA